MATASNGVTVVVSTGTANNVVVAPTGGAYVSSGFATLTTADDSVYSTSQPSTNAAGGLDDSASTSLSGATSQISSSDVFATARSEGGRRAHLHGALLVGCGVVAAVWLAL